MLMPYHVKIILLPEPLLPRAFHLPLKLDDILAQNEPGFEETHEHSRRDWHEMLAAPRISHKDGAVFPGRKYTQSQNEVTRDVGRPVAPVIPHMDSPVAAVGEAPDSGGFRVKVEGANFEIVHFGWSFIFYIAYRIPCRR